MSTYGFLTIPVARVAANRANTVRHELIINYTYCILARTVATLAGTGQRIITASKTTIALTHDVPVPYR